MSRSPARAVADLSQGSILATVEIAAAPEKVFAALTDPALVPLWWGSADTYKVTAWEGKLEVGGAWTSSGVGADGHAFSVGGEYLAIDPPRLLVHTWRAPWDGDNATTVTYRLEATATGTRVTLRHEGFADRAASCAGHAEGWERVLGWLTAFLAPAPAASHFFVKLHPPRPDFARTLSPAERAAMDAHSAYWKARLAAGGVVAFGPVNDPAGAWGLGLLAAKDAAEAQAFVEGDPARAVGLRPELLPVFRLITP
jgi:uncharacterized protein YndB with AHSA1/START domain